MQAASPGETVENWLIRNGQTPRMRELLWDPLALAALNQPTDQAAAPTFARVLAEMFGADPRAAAIALPTKPLHLMYAEPAREYIERHGGAVRTGAPAKIAVVNDERSPACAPQANSGEVGHVISAVPWFALADLFDEAPPRSRTSSRAPAAMASSPIVTVNLWFDRPRDGRTVHRLARPRDAVGVRQASRLRRRRLASVAGVERRGVDRWRRPTRS